MPFDKEILQRCRPDFYKKYFVEATTKFSEEDFEKWLQLRDKAVPSSPEQWFFLANDLLGYCFQEDVHTELFEQFIQLDLKSGKTFYQLSEEIKKVLILWSRGTFKSTAVIVFIVACLLFDPDLFIMIISGNEKLAKRILKEVKSHFESPNAKFEKLFPEYCGKRMGNTYEFEIPCRHDAHLGSPSVGISSGKSAKAGLHPDLLVCDDIVHELNYRSPTLLEKCWEEYQMFEPLVNPGGYTVCAGTRYSFGDTWEKMQELAQSEMKLFGRAVWRISIKTCWKNGDQAQGPFFEERTISHRGKDKVIGNSEDFLMRKKNTMGPELFSCQYENNPIPGGTQSFTPALLDRQTFHYLIPPKESGFDGPVLPPHGIDFAVGDLSFVGSEKRDYSVFYICRLWNSAIWVYDCVCGQWGTRELTENLWNEVIFRSRPQVVFIEKIPSWDSYDYAFRSYATQRDIQRYPIQWMNMGNTADAKLIRIGSTQGPLAQRRLWLYAGMKEYATLRTQLEKFPKCGRRDDFADCLGLVTNAPTGWYGTAMTDINHIPEMLRKARMEDETVASIGKAGSVIVC